MTYTFHVSLLDRKNLSAEIYRQIRQAISDGQLRSGERLPPIRELAQSLSVSRMTVTTAYERLAGEGLVSSKIGAGTFVSSGNARTESAAPARSTALQPLPIWTTMPLPTALDRPARFDFRTGVPDERLFPHRIWRRLLGKSATSVTGRYKQPAGDVGLRMALTHHIGMSRGIQATYDQVLITNGTQQALDVVARTLLAPGDLVAVEDPGYAPPRRLFSSLGLRIASVPVDADGIVVDAIEPGTKAIYVTPSHQYPLGMAMSLPRRRALLDWADRNDAAILEDDYDCEFRFGGRPVDPLQTLDTSGRVIYIGTFSKTLLPELRLGFIVGPPPLLPALTGAKAVVDWHSSSPIQLAVGRLIEEGAFARHVRKLGMAYRERHRLISQTIRKDFHDTLELIESETGLHLATCARRHSVDQIEAAAHAALQKGVAVQTLACFAASDARLAGFVFGYGGIATQDIREGLWLLRECLQ